jgi:TatD DNase family protein
VPGIERANFELVIGLAERYKHCALALGIHPSFVDRAEEGDLDVLAKLVEQTQPVAIGEIGLDFYAERGEAGYNREKQEHYFSEQLKLARDFDLPVILHVRKAIDQVLKHLRRIKVRGGIAHAFNGSRQQADIFIDMGFKLGYGGAMTYPGSLRIRELAATLPLEAIVLETDAPDIPPEWIGHQGRNTPDQLLDIAQTLASLRGIDVAQVAETTTKNVLQALPKIADLCTPPQVLH